MLFFCFRRGPRCKRRRFRLEKKKLSKKKIGPRYLRKFTRVPGHVYYLPGPESRPGVARVISESMLSPSEEGTSIEKKCVKLRGYTDFQVGVYGSGHG